MKGRPYIYAALVVLMGPAFLALETRSLPQATRAAPAAANNGTYYRVETISLAEKMSPEISGLAFSPDGRLALVNRRGELWIGDPLRGGWRLFADGLHEPLGLIWEEEGLFYVLQRPELTRVRDSDGDGRADLYETVSDAWGITDNYHEFAYGLKRDPQGNFLGGLGLDSGGEKILSRIDRSRGPLNVEPVLDDTQRSAVPYRGWTFKVTPEGEFIPFALGFRQPSGVGVSPEGDFFVTDNQGDWVASSALLHVRQGRFYGHPSSLRWEAGFDPKRVSPEALYRRRTPPAVILPHGPMGGSPGEPVWDLTGGRFGPFGGQVFAGDFTSLISRVFLEKVAGQYQGACFPFLRGAGLREGNMRLAFSPDGSLYVAQTTRGWGEGDGLQRVVWNGKIPPEILAVELTPEGFALSFTRPMDPARLSDPRNYVVSRFRYYYHSKYGSPQVDATPVPVTRAEAAAAGTRVDLVPAELVPGFVYQLEVEKLVSRDGEALLNPIAFYTLNRLLTGDMGVHGTSRLPEPEAAPAVDGWDAVKELVPDVQSGEAVYMRYCVACHQLDGRGVPALAGSNFQRPGSALEERTEAELFETISEGREEAGMPPFGNVLSGEEMRHVLEYIRATFGGRGEGSPPAGAR